MPFSWAVYDKVSVSSRAIERLIRWAIRHGDAWLEANQVG